MAPVRSHLFARGRLYLKTRSPRSGRCVLYQILTQNQGLGQPFWMPGFFNPLCDSGCHRIEKLRHQFIFDGRDVPYPRRTSHAICFKGLYPNRLFLLLLQGLALAAKSLIIISKKNANETTE